MNRYIIAINEKDSKEPVLFLVFAEDTREYVSQVISEAQNELNYTDCCDLMDYVCDTYGYRWEDFSYDILFDM